MSRIAARGRTLPAPATLVCLVLTAAALTSCSPAPQQAPAPAAAPSNSPAAAAENRAAQDDSGSRPENATKMWTLAIVAAKDYQAFMGGGLEAQLGLPNPLGPAGAAEAANAAKPWGLIVLSDGEAVVPIVCLPVERPVEIFEMAAIFGGQPRPGADGTIELSLGAYPPVYFKSQGGWTFASLSTDAFAQLPADFEAQFARQLGEYDTSAALLGRNVPEAIRRPLLDAMRSGFNDAMRQLPDESDEAFASRRNEATAELERRIAGIEEFDSVSVGWTTDARRMRRRIDMAYQFKPGGKMASELKAQPIGRTNFAGFRPADSTVAFSVARNAEAPENGARIQGEAADGQTNLPAGGGNPQPDGGDLAEWVKEGVKLFVDEFEITDEAARAALDAAGNDLAEAFAAGSGEKLDAAASLRLTPGERPMMIFPFGIMPGATEPGQADQPAQPPKPDEITLLAAAYCREPGRIESALARLVPVVDKLPHIKSIQMNVAEHEGVKLHQLTLAPPEGLEVAGVPLALPAPFEVAIGIGDKAVYLGFGNDHLAALRAAIDASRAAPDKQTPALEAIASLGPIVDVAATKVEDLNLRAMLQLVSALLHSDPQIRDRIRLAETAVPNGFGYRVDVDEGAMQALQIIIMSQAQQRMLGGGF
jgi:hypothetical protein